MSNAYPTEIFTAFAFLGFIMCMIPMPWHLRAWNSGTILYMLWVGIGCLIHSANSVVWKDNAIDWAPIWCDICTRYIVGAAVGIPASSLCINRRLYLVAKNTAITKSGKIRIIVTDLSIGLGLPFLQMGLYYVIQGHRFNILETVGCWPAAWMTWVGYVVLYGPTILVGLVAGYYAIHNIYLINRRRAQFKELLSDQLNVTSGLYTRLIVLSAAEPLCTIPITVFFIVATASNGVVPWISWQNTHSHFNRADQFPAIIWRSAPGAAGIELTRWLYVVCAFVFFGFFGFAAEARDHYSLAIRFVLNRIGLYVSPRMGILTFRTASNDGSATNSKDGTSRTFFHDKRHHHINPITTPTTSDLEIDYLSKTDAPFSMDESHVYALDRSTNEIGIATDSDALTSTVTLPPVAFIPTGQRLVVDLRTGATDLVDHGC